MIQIIGNLFLVIAEYASYSLWWITPVVAISIPGVFISLFIKGREPWTLETVRFMFFILLIKVTFAFAFYGFGVFVQWVFNA